MHDRMRCITALSWPELFILSITVHPGENFSDALLQVRDHGGGCWSASVGVEGVLHQAFFPSRASALAAYAASAAPGTALPAVAAAAEEEYYLEQRRQWALRERELQQREALQRQERLEADQQRRPAPQQQQQQQQQMLQASGSGVGLKEQPQPSAGSASLATAEADSTATAHDDRGGMDIDQPAAGSGGRDRTSVPAVAPHQREKHENSVQSAAPEVVELVAEDGSAEVRIGNGNRPSKTVADAKSAEKARITIQPERLIQGR